MIWGKKCHNPIVQNHQDSGNRIWTMGLQKGIQEVYIMFRNRTFMKVKAHQICTIILYTQRRLPIMSGIIRRDDTREQVFRLNRIVDLQMKRHSRHSKNDSAKGLIHNHIFQPVLTLCLFYFMLISIIYLYTFTESGF